MENVRNRMKMTLVSNSRTCFTLINKTSFRNRTIYNDSLSAIYYKNLNIIWKNRFLWNSTFWIFQKPWSIISTLWENIMEMILSYFVWTQVCNLKRKSYVTYFVSLIFNLYYRFPYVSCKHERFKWRFEVQSLI